MLNSILIRRIQRFFCQKKIILNNMLETAKNMIFLLFFEIEFLQVVENIYEYSCYVSYIECRYFSLKHHENKSFFFLMLKHFIYFFSENMATRLFRLLVRERRLAARILVVGSKRFLATVRVCLPCIVYGQECLIRYILRKNCLCINVTSK